MEKIKIINKNNIKNLPETTGIYVFYKKNFLNAKRYTLSPIYIGKAVNIKNRVKNHFLQPTYKDNFFINSVDKIGFTETGSEISALLLEAKLIKKYQPKFNQAWRDDKNYFYVAIIKNKVGIPYILITHQLQENFKFKYVGPFTDGTSLKKALRFLRKIFPFYSSPRHSKLKCQFCHLDLCPGPYLNFPEYKKNIKKLILILEGKSNSVLNSLKKEMIFASKERSFEKAGRIRDQFFALEKVMSHKNVNVKMPCFDGEKPGINAWGRIEAYDISNIQGKFATGSMVVFTNGKPDKSQYKKFRIKMKNEPNDIAMIKEVLQRRFSHTEWKFPEIILIDGGKAQLNVAINSKLQAPNHKQIKIIAIAKGGQELFIEGKNKPIPLKNLPQEIYNLIKNLDSEAHRFAITYHKKLRKQNLLK